MLRVVLGKERGVHGQEACGEEMIEQSLLPRSASWHTQEYLRARGWTCWREVTSCGLVLLYVRRTGSTIYWGAYR